MNARGEVDFMSVNEYVCLTNCDSATDVSVLKRLIRAAYHQFRSVSRKRSRSNSVNFMKHHINAEPRKHDVMTDLISFRVTVRFCSRSTKI